MNSEISSSVAGVICVGIILIGTVLPSFLLSRLLKIEHDEFPDQWVKDGRPSGIPFWFSAQDLHLMNFRSAPWIMGTWWLFKTPDWIKGHSSATKLLMYYRLISFSFSLGLLSLCLLFLFLSPT